MDNDRLQELIAAIEAERDALIQQANAQIAYLNGKIDALKELAATPEGADGEAE